VSGEEEQIIMVEKSSGQYIPGQPVALVSNTKSRFSKHGLVCLVLLLPLFFGGCAGKIHYAKKGEQLYRQKKYEESVEYLQKAIAEDPQYALGYILLGWNYNKLQEFAKAIDSYKHGLQLDPSLEHDTYWDVYEGLGYCYYKTGNNKQALHFLNKALLEDPYDAGKAGHLNKMGRAWRNLEEYDKALESYHKALDIQPKYKYATANIAEVYRRTGRFDLALEWARKAQAIDSDYSWPLRIMASIYFDQGNPAAAKESYDKSVAMDSENRSAYNARAWFLTMQGKYQEALADVNKALALSPEYAAALHTRGRIYLAQGKDDLALADFRQAEQIRGKTSPMQQIDMGILLLKMGKKQEAVQALKSVGSVPGYWQYDASGKEYSKRLVRLQKMVGVGADADVISSEPVLAKKAVKDVQAGIESALATATNEDTRAILKYIQQAGGGIDEVTRTGLIESALGTAVNGNTRNVLQKMR
jgi:tetratricopeptide (TPR) repeat protein